MEIEQYFFEAFENMERLGPGSTESTKKAITLYPASKSAIKILDVGCGVGTHTFLLAEQFPEAEITAIDNYAPYIEQLNKTAESKGISGRVRGIVMSMFEMEFPNENFDLIWAEGSIYIAGFKRGINDWKHLLKPEAYLICSEISWLKTCPSDESYNYWDTEYPEIDTIENKIKQIESAGYSPKSYFICPVTDWTANYYDFLQNSVDTMRKKYVGNETASAVINMIETEINVYKRNSDDYSYVFYAMARI